VSDAPPASADVPAVPVLRALGDRRSIRCFDADRPVERWKVGAIVVRKGECMAGATNSRWPGPSRA
jgi:hypothetical protein